MTDEIEITVSVRHGDRGSVFDADGNPIPQCIEANLTTGRCVCFVTDADGKCKPNPERTEIERVVVMHKAPLRFDRKLTHP